MRFQLLEKSYPAKFNHLQNSKYVASELVGFAADLVILAKTPPRVICADSHQLFASSDSCSGVTAAACPSSAWGVSWAGRLLALLVIKILAQRCFLQYSQS